MWHEIPTPDHRLWNPLYASMHESADMPLVRFDRVAYARFEERLDADLAKLIARWSRSVLLSSNRGRLPSRR